MIVSRYFMVTPLHPAAVVEVGSESIDVVAVEVSEHLDGLQLFLTHTRPAVAGRGDLEANLVGRHAFQRAVGYRAPVLPEQAGEL